MDGCSTDLVLKELKRIKWLLVLIVVALLSVPVSLLYIGWEVASLLQETPADDEEGTVETRAKDLLRHPRLDELGQLINRRANDHPHDARVLSYHARLTGEREHRLTLLDRAEPLAPREPERPKAVAPERVEQTRSAFDRQ